MNCVSCDDSAGDRYVPVDIDEHGQLIVTHDDPKCAILDERDDIMTAVRIANTDEARSLAGDYGIEFPAGRGRPPLRRLAQAILDAGHEITDTAYFSAAMAERSSGRETLRAALESIVAAGDNALSVAETMLEGLTEVLDAPRAQRPSAAKAAAKYKVSASVPNKNGKGRHPAKVVLTVAEIREAAATTDVRGRPSSESAVLAAAALKGWGDVSELKSAKVERVEVSV